MTKNSNYAEQILSSGKALHDGKKIAFLPAAGQRFSGAGLLPGSWLYMNKKYDGLIASRGDATLGNLLQEAGQGEKVSNGSRVKAWRNVWEENGIPTTVYVKVYNLGHYRFRYFGRLSRGAWEALNYQSLAATGVPVPDVIAVGEVRSFGRPVSCIIITRGIEQTVQLDEFLPSAAGSNPVLRLQLIELLAATTAAAHKRHFYHRDLKARNVLVRHQSGESTLSVHWIDCPKGGRSRFRAMYHASVDLGDLIKTLAVHLSAEELLSFFNQYATVLGNNHSGKDILTVVAQRLARKENLPPALRELIL